MMSGDANETKESSKPGTTAARDAHATGERARSLTRRGNRIVGYIVIITTLVLLVLITGWWLAG